MAAQQGRTRPMSVASSGSSFDMVSLPDRSSSPAWSDEELGSQDAQCPSLCQCGPPPSPAHAWAYEIIVMPTSDSSSAGDESDADLSSCPTCGAGDDSGSVHSEAGSTTAWTVVGGPPPTILVDSSINPNVHNTVGCNVRTLQSPCDNHSACDDGHNESHDDSDAANKDEDSSSESNSSSETDHDGPNSPTVLDRYAKEADRDDDDSEGGHSNGTDDDSDGSAVTERPPMAAQRSITVLPRPVTMSVTNASEARQSIDTFLEDSDAFMRDKANKLRLWHALCIELGIVRIRDEDEWDSDSNSDSSEEWSRTCKPLPYRHLPMSLGKAHKLLKRHAHVNIGEYLAARSDPSRHHANVDVAGKYADLVYPSKAALKRSLLKHRGFVNPAQAKSEWLEPLLKDLGFKRARQVKEASERARWASGSAPNDSGRGSRVGSSRNTGGAQVGQRG